MAALDLMGRRWMLRILWELRAAPLTFRALQQACGNLSPTMASRRLMELRSAGLVRRAEAAGFCLTDLGRDLLDALAPLQLWAKSWEANRHGRSSRKRS
jgi:DNA-binding HxlR family transcriptional regulator